MLRMFRGISESKMRRALLMAYLVRHASNLISYRVSHAMIKKPSSLMSPLCLSNNRTAIQNSVTCTAFTRDEMFYTLLAMLSVVDAP